MREIMRDIEQDRGRKLKKDIGKGREKRGRNRGRYRKL